MKDYYYILGIGRSATADHIKSAYRKLSLKFHPDKNDGDKFFEERFKEIQEAYDTLSQTERKRNYDFNLNNKGNANRQYDNSYEDKLRNDFDQELKKRKKEFEDELSRKEKEFAEQIKKTQEEAKRKYQTPEQRAAEEAENKKKREEYERIQEHNKRIRELESFKISLKEKETSLDSLNKSIKIKQHEISQIQNEIKTLQGVLNSKDLQSQSKKKIIVILGLLGFTSVLCLFFFMKNSSNNQFSDEATKQHINSLTTEIEKNEKNTKKLSSPIETRTVVNNRNNTNDQNVKSKNTTDKPAPAMTNEFHPPMSLPTNTSLANTAVTKLRRAYGGIVVSENDGHGLVAAESDLGKMNWYNGNQDCKNFAHNGYYDWRLPSKEELQELYKKRNEIGGFSRSAYWCSSESVRDQAWFIMFSDGSWNDIGKDDRNYVRAVRSY